MGIPFLGFLSKVIDPIFKGIDSLSTSDEEKGLIKIELEKLKNAVTTELLGLEAKRLELEGTLIQAQSAVIIAEAQSQSWIARNWRPLVMLNFAVLIVLVATGVMDTDALNAVPDQLWKLITLGIGGYMTLRSVDKAAPGLIKGLLKNKETLS